MEQILILEDDIALNQGLCKALKTENRKIVSCETIKVARDQLLCGCPSLILLDINLPDGSGLDFLQELKRNYPTIPVILLTANDTDMDIVKGLELGADDYITKPFSMPVLLRKIAAVLRRSNRETDEKYQIITYGNLLLNCDSYTATVDGANFELTQKEFEILRELLTHQGRILTRQNLLDKLWRYDFYGDERVVDTHIKNLRKKLGIDFIQTIRGVGYKVDKEN